MDKMEEPEEPGSGWQDEVHVMSDVHVGCRPEATSCTTVFSVAGGGNSTRESWDPELRLNQRELENEDDGDDGSVSTVVTYDENGDLILPRRHKRQRHSQRNLNGELITIHHQLTTRLPGVGLQIWRGALLLADFLLDTNSSSLQFHNINVIELGAGTGLTGIVMAKAAKRVFITDRDADILDNCTRNVLANSGLYLHGEGSVQVRKLDWLQSWPPAASHSVEDGDASRLSLSSLTNYTYAWSEQDLNEARSATVLLAADVVYSPELTEAFFAVLDKIMDFGNTKTLFLALEKRFNFSVDELDVVAYGYKQFRSFFHVRESGTDSCNMDATEDVLVPNDFERKFAGRQIPIDQVQQHIVEYERGKDLELWEITRCKCQENGAKHQENGAKHQ